MDPTRFELAPQRLEGVRATFEHYGPCMDFYFTFSSHDLIKSREKKSFRFFFLQERFSSLPEKAFSVYLYLSWEMVVPKSHYEIDTRLPFSHNQEYRLQIYSCLWVLFLAWR